MQYWLNSISNCSGTTIFSCASLRLPATTRGLLAMFDRLTYEFLEINLLLTFYEGTPRRRFPHRALQNVRRSGHGRADAPAATGRDPLQRELRRSLTPA